MGDKRQNVILVTADSLRADHCGFLNPDVELTPTLDALAEDGTVYENAVAPGPRTLTSIPEMLTGEILPHSAPQLYSEHVSRFANHVERHPTLPERLSERGFTTVAFSANPWTSTRCGIDETFDEFHDIGTTDSGPVNSAVNALLSGTSAETLGHWFEQWRQGRSFFSQWPTFFDEIRETIRDVPEPYFLWVFLLEPHNPYLIPRRDRVESSTFSMYHGILRSNAMISHTSNFSASNYRSDLPPRVERDIERAYRDAVRSVDRFVRRLTDAVSGEDTLFAFNADHGEAFNEHGTYGHQQALYEENVHVPLLVRDSSSSEGTTVSRPVSLRSLPDLLVAASRDETPVSSDEWTEQYVITRSEDGSTIAVRGEETKYIRTEDGEQLYDLTEDPNERRNLADERDTSRFRQRIAEYLERVPSGATDVSETEISPDVQRRLSMLGYSERNDVR